MIKLYNVSMIFEHEKRALDNISLQIGHGEFVYITGSSGAGKTTLLRLLYADIIPSNGVVMIADKDVGRIERGSIPYLRRNLGVVFQDYRLIESKTVYENLALSLEIFYMGRKKMSNLIFFLLKTLEIFSRRNTVVKYLSGGEKQRVAIARALINNPPIILLDEPTSNVDENKSDGIIKLLQKLSGDKTVVVATHDQNLINKFPSRRIGLNNGKLVFDSAKENEKIILPD